MEAIKTAYLWVITSSKDPNKLSLTIKGALGTLVTLLTILLGLAHVDVGSQLTNLVDLIIQLVQSVAATISVIVTVYGAVRKIWITIKGQHPLFIK